MGFGIDTLREKREREKLAMPVRLKQRTYRTVDWMPRCADAHGKVPTDAAFLVGPEGATIDDETAKALGLVDGGMPQVKEGGDGVEDKGPRQRMDKSGRKKPKEGRDIRKPPEEDEGEDGVDSAESPTVDFASVTDDPREQAILNVMADMMAEAEAGDDEASARLLTTDGAPDSRVLSGRVPEDVGDVSAAERDRLFALYRKATDVNY